MCRRLRVNIPEGTDQIILLRQWSGNFLTNDFAENSFFGHDDSLMQLRDKKKKAAPILAQRLYEFSPKMKCEYQSTSIAPLPTPS